MNIEYLKPAIPLIEQWIDNYIDEHKNERKKVIDADFERLNHAFSNAILKNTYYVVVDNIQTPPLEDFGLSELSLFDHQTYSGITYKDTYFVIKNKAHIESLHFHEMIHVVQWHELGSEKFLLLYAAGLLQCGYRNAPLEEIAYRLQQLFEQGKNLLNVELLVKEHCRSLDRKN